MKFLKKILRVLIFQILESCVEGGWDANELIERYTEKSMETCKLFKIFMNY